MKEAIKVKIKNDTAGVGHDPGKEFTLHWWDHAFNKAAGNINVKVTEEGVDVSKDESNQKNGKTMFNKDMLYGRFVKGATLENNEDGVSQEVKHGDSSDSEEEEEPASVSQLSDEELFKKCGGLTAHKAARHGFKLNGKLLRIQRQESDLPTSDDSVAREEKCEKKTKKKAKKNKEETMLQSETEALDKTAGDNSQKKSSKKAKKRKLSETNVHEVTDEIENQNDSSSSKKSKKKKEKEENIDSPEIALEENTIDVSAVADIDTKLTDCELNTQVNAEKESKKKKKKSKKCKDGIDALVETEMECPETETEVKSKKKKKKKSKHR
ncbi:G patch domain-containing protein 4 [Lingula anatina]|uniref:G patch domain-containing protein 4 n=1 Tax=Lingula anatina TaxID=7574 RepID=A0A1S3I5F4_LINAN|nr:G patch domain-containing protein 4 [Lingula anatina]XP_013393062.1 G patch domain-containing protein 4 [Lingula anatina]|eukprot:XP_013393061.1 G patch domain-containing protein 4 [Lingula anatina]